jgi:List-Bact-rpt repeat protein
MNRALAVLFSAVGLFSASIPTRAGVMDTNPPIIAISTPVSGYRSLTNAVIIQGTAQDGESEVALVEFRLENAGGTNSYQPADGTNVWSAMVAGLIAGSNTVRFRARDVSGNLSTEPWRYIFHVVTSPLTISNTGVGSVSPNLNGQNLEIGRSYSLTATAGKGFVFDSWRIGSEIVSSSPSLLILMQSNLVLSVYFVTNPFPAVAGVYQGLFYDSNGVAHASSGFFDGKVTDQGGFSAKLRSGSNKDPVSGRFTAAGFFSNSIPRKNLDPISVVLQLNLSGGDVITGQLITSNGTAQLTAPRAGYSKNNPAPQAGKYTLLLPGNGEVGHGFGAVTVNTAGKVSLSGKLGDGTSASQKAILSGAGEWPFYLSLYSGKGSILGWLSFVSEPTHDLTGSVTWIRPAQPDSDLYPGGFTNQMEALGSIYGFTNGIPIFNFSTGQVALINGNLPANLTNQVIFANNKGTGSNQLTLTITTSSGLIKGSMVNPATGGKITLNAAVLQKQNAGFGNFPGTNQTGQVLIGP